MEMYHKNPKKSELVTGHSVFNKNMMHAHATEFDRANLLAMLYGVILVDVLT